MSEFVIALLELLEAEGRAFRRAFRRASFGVAFLCIATLFVIAGFGFLMASGYWALAAFLSASLAALIMGSLILLIAAALGIAAYRALR
ncbi:MAG: hypothetical protein B7X12_01620 [Halothiobacillus sp. 20-53-49]|nr:hypothetical protein [Halothiobacillaceae bacterium]OYV47241.1 MAG: hypothetical protein B7X12_01620 [Halothiobacillus sp. 20-53-49]HUM98910.1 hypothetical protein [Halothiobacillus sp.]